MSDPYNYLEGKYKITRQALSLIYKYGYGLSLETKSDIIVRDIDLLKKISKKNNVIIKITITTFDDELARKIEPNAPLPSKRFEAIKAISDAGITVGVLLIPVLPFITDNTNNIKNIIRLSSINGAKFVYSHMGVTLRDNQRDYYFQKLDELFSGLSEKYKLLYKNNYFCKTNNEMENVFKKSCEQFGIKYKMNDIIKAYKLCKGNKQISLF